MPTRAERDDNGVVLKFGGGINSRASEDEISPVECATGQNFVLDPGNSEFRPRMPFDLVGTAPNGEQIRGFVSLLKQDGTVGFAVQAGTTVYQVNASYEFTSIGTVAAGSNLRGRLEANSQVDDKVIISDLSLAEEVHEWDGTTFQSVTFLDENGSGFGTFRAKHVIMDGDRAIYANVYDNGNTYPHLIIGSKPGGLAASPGSSNFSVISTGQRPASALSDEDPWFLTTPDLRPVNGMVGAFGLVAISTEKGSMFKLTGQSAKDYSVLPLYPRSGAAGYESVVFAGNDILYGRPGVIESLLDTDRYGNTEANDLTIRVANSIASYTGWTLAYNSRNKRTYCFPNSASECWVLFGSVRDVTQEVSPWSVWRTAHPVAMQPTAVMAALDPADGLEYVFFGDSSGRVFRMEGTGTAGDAGQYGIEVSRLSGLITVPEDGQSFIIHGYLKHRYNLSSTVRLRFEYSGYNVFNEEITIDLGEPSSRTVYGAGAYYGGAFYYGTPFVGRLTRRSFGVAGQGNEFQVRITVDGVNYWSINEIGLRFETAG